MIHKWNARLHAIVWTTQTQSGVSRQRLSIYSTSGGYPIRRLLLSYLLARVLTLMLE